MSHECPADDCVVSCDAVLMCRKHWRMVPRFMQREVNGAWRAFQKADVTLKGQGRADVFRVYAVARRAAVDLVNGRLSKA